VSLPLKDLVTEERPYFAPLLGALPAPHSEQYRFHFDMTKCIGCHCCEVACNEQNNNPADIHWRRVGEIEGGAYPFTQRFYLSIGCNHCLEPSCLTGCPVDAYSKNPANGLVLHSAEACIGCQYCIWNCPYGVPQYNPERGVVGKCDMCHERVAEGRDPACVSACPQEAIQIETVNIAEWRLNYGAFANSPGLPEAEQTLSTTRVTLPASMPTEVRNADQTRVRPERSHLPLVFMTVLTQLAVGAFCGVWLLASMGRAANWNLASLAALGIGLTALAASTLHLGRPIYAYRALKMWRRSWLSREVLLFTLFAGLASAYSAALRFGLPASAALGAMTALFGIGGVTASAFIYLVPARPAWNSRYTIAEFFLTGAILGSLFLSALGFTLTVFAVVAAVAQLLNQGLKFLWLIRSDEFELQGSARLLSADLQNLFLARFGLLVAGGVAFPLAGFFAPALAAALAAEWIGRYLFFVSVVPRNMAAGFFETGKVAA
jgi:formate dehydrogenase iron-sulfur subunit